jgi:hypothetical protein
VFREGLSVAISSVTEPLGDPEIGRPAASILDKLRYRSALTSDDNGANDGGGWS